MSPRNCLALGALLAALAVVIGAFGAHWLRGEMPRWYTDAQMQQRMLENWETGVRYQMYSALGLVAAGLWASQRRGRQVRFISYAFLAGTLLFSGLLYLLVLTGQTTLGKVVPVGGFAMIVGWSLLAWQVWQDHAAKELKEYS